MKVWGGGSRGGGGYLRNEKKNMNSEFATRNSIFENSEIFVKFTRFFRE
jgi:hypothetical protein